MIKAEFSASQSSVSHDSSEIILICWSAVQETFIIIIITIKIKTVEYILFWILWWIEKSKDQRLSEIKKLL